MDASEIMSSRVYTIRSDATVVDAANVMLDHNISALPVLNDRDRLVGIMSHSDFFLMPINDPAMRGTVFEIFGNIFVNRENIGNLHSVLSRTLVSDVMSTPVVTVKEGTQVEEIVSIMYRRRLKRLPVVRDEKLVGIITRHDFVRLAATIGRE